MLDISLITFGYLNLYIVCYQADSTISTVRSFTAFGPMQHVDQTPMIRPFTQYQYRLVVVNDVGSGVSDWADIVTKSASEVFDIRYTMSQWISS